MQALSVGSEARTTNVTKECESQEHLRGNTAGISGLASFAYFATFAFQTSPACLLLDEL